jgi:hypothetical protein
LYLNGIYADDEDKLGVAYSPSSFAIFKEKISSIVDTADIPNADDALLRIEQALVVHELGQLLGLVNRGYISNFAHEDNAHQHYCNHTILIHDVEYPNCVMHHEIENASILNLYTSLGKIPNDFCEYCRRDLEVIRGKV